MPVDILESSLRLMNEGKRRERSEFDFGLVVPAGGNLGERLSSHDGLLAESLKFAFLRRRPGAQNRC